MPKGLCNAPIAAKLRKGIGFMQMVPDLHMMSTWTSGLMMKTFMTLATQKWYMTLSTLLLNCSCLLKNLDSSSFMLAICLFPLNFPVFQYCSLWVCLTLNVIPCTSIQYYAHANDGTWPCSVIWTFLLDVLFCYMNNPGTKFSLFKYLELMPVVPCCLSQNIYAVVMKIVVCFTLISHPSLGYSYLLSFFYQFLCMTILTIFFYFCVVQPFRFHWCPFGRLAQLPSLFEYVLL